MTAPTQTGAAVTTELPEEEETLNRNPRLDYLEGLAGRIDNERHQDLEDTMAADPGMKHLQSSMDGTEGAEPELEQEGLVSAEAIDPEEKNNVPAADDFVEGKLPDYLIQQDGGYFMRAKVDGEERLIPLDQARTQLQKEQAVEDRFRYVNKKVLELQQREQALDARENSTQQSAKPAVPIEKNPLPSQEGVDDEALDTEAKELVNKLFTADEDEAAGVLARVLRKNRAPVTAPVDPNELVSRTTVAVMNKIQQDKVKADVKSGFNQFAQTYPAIVEDPQLFRMADGMTDEIAAEHPDWLPSQVMDEAGKRTQQWVEQHTRPAEAGIETPPEPETKNLRLERKEQLKPMPRSTSSRHEVPPEDAPQTPADIVRELREARGQPV